jgi:hypothetical protein
MNSEQLLADYEVDVECPDVSGMEHLQTCLFMMILKNSGIEMRIDPKIGFGLHGIQ